MNAARSKLSGLMDTVAKHARPAVSAAEKEVTTRYSKMMKDNQDYVVKDQAHASKLLKQWWFTKLARWVARCKTAAAAIGAEIVANLGHSLFRNASRRCSIFPRLLFLQLEHQMKRGPTKTN